MAQKVICLQAWGEGYWTRNILKEIWTRNPANMQEILSQSRKNLPRNPDNLWSSLNDGQESHRVLRSSSCENAGRTFYIEYKIKPTIWTSLLSRLMLHKTTNVQATFTFLGPCTQASSNDKPCGSLTISTWRFLILTAANSAFKPLESLICRIWLESAEKSRWNRISKQLLSKNTQAETCLSEEKG